MNKLFLTFFSMALMAISINAQEVCSFNPDNALGLDSDKGTALAAGTVIGETASIIATVGADDTYKPQSVKANVTGGGINGGLQGSSSPKDADSGIPATTLLAPVSGAYFQFEAKADGYLYVIHKASSNKAYTVFEEGMAIGYKFAAIGDASTDLGDVYDFELKGEGELNLLMNPVEWAEREYLKATFPNKYAAHLSTDAEGKETWDAIKVNGIGVISFPVYKDCKYIVNANSSKITAGGFVFSTEENVTISSDGLIIIGKGGDINKVELYYNYITKGKVAEVIANPYGRYRGNVVIPSTVTLDGEEYTVTKIAENAFNDCSGLTSVTIPNSVTSIASYAFKDCNGLTSVTIPNSVTSIGSYAFNNCSGLTSITIPNSVTSIGWGAFVDCSSLTSVFIPNSVTFIVDHAFEDCSGLTSVTIPNSVTSIGSSAFNGCSDLTSVTIPNSVTSIGSRAFSYCSGMTSVTIPNSVTSIGWGAFADCSSLTSVTIPNSVTSIVAGVFEYCSDLTSVTIPNSVTSIDEWAFAYCNGLTSITIGSGIKYIYNQAFADCPELTDVYCYAENVPSTNVDAFEGSYIEYATLHVPKGCIGAYKDVKPWKNFKSIVEIVDAKVELNKTEANIEKGKTLTLKATITPSDLADKSVTWKSSNKKVATVSSSGKVKGVKVGTATITCTSNATGLKATCTVNVVNGLVTLNKTEACVQKGKTMTLKATVTPKTLADKSVTWKSSDTKIATVTKAGKVKGVKYGTATIACTSVATGAKATCQVTVGKVVVSISEVSIKKSRGITLEATVYPEDLADKSVTWKSSDKSIATVDKEGRVKGIKAGTATITCTSVATGLKGTCTVTVLSNSEARSMIGDDDELTGLKELESSAVAEPFDVYDLSGRKVLHQVTSLDGLSDGIYIVNGKKILKKK